MRYDYCVIGGGVVGLATARALLERRPEASLLLLEKEPTLGAHQTGHNSGVIHAGVYYAPGSLKARLCAQGAAATKAFARQHGIPYLSTGKLVVATTTTELIRMRELHERSTRNGLEVALITGPQLRELEPHIDGLGALLVPATAVIDYREICRALADELAQRGAQVVTSARVVGIDERADGITLTCLDREFLTDRLVVCAGLQADRLAKLGGVRTQFQIVPFRGEYFRLPPARNDLIKHLIYPVPDPDLPFLGVHLTRTIDGAVTVGPSAVLGFSREGYRKGSANARDVWDYLRFPGMWQVARNNLMTGAREMRNSAFKRAYLRECRKYCPELTVSDLQPEPAGIRAQAVLRDGTLVEDFYFEQTARSLHVCNAPSPAATSALPIGQMIADRLAS